ncbi:MAG: IS1380 family transposase [Ideonella sp.]|nr:IS1380 family transposase [Ideonella sp.]
MTDFIIKRLPYDLSSNAGLALVGQYLQRLDLSGRLDRRFPVGVGGIANSDIVKSYLGLLVQGKNDFDAIEAFRGDAFFKRSLGISTVPSSPTLRQRMNTHAQSWFTLAGDLNEALLSPRAGKGVAKGAGMAVDFGSLPCGYMPVDWDTFVMNNDGSKKDDVGRTYQGVDGYTPSVTYLGSLGYCLELALRPGVQHSALETELNLERVLPMATRLTAMPLLFRADSGLCSLKVMQEIQAQASALKREIAFIIKWNPRSTPAETIAAQRVADADTMWCHWREGKRECQWSEAITLQGVGTEAQAVRRIYRLTERTIDKQGQAQLLPAYKLEGWTTTLPERFTCADIIALYRDHGTHEQFHSEFKTDMDLERLPSGKFDTNYLVCALAAVAMNLLRLIGQNTLNGKDAPLRHKAKRRRIKTVLQEIMFKAARMIRHAGRWALGLGANDSAYIVFERLYRQMTPQAKPAPA